MGGEFEEEVGQNCKSVEVAVKQLLLFALSDTESASEAAFLKESKKAALPLLNLMEIVYYFIEIQKKDLSEDLAAEVCNRTMSARNEVFSFLKRAQGITLKTSVVQFPAKRKELHDEFQKVITSLKMVETATINLQNARRRYPVNPPAPISIAPSVDISGILASLKKFLEFVKKNDNDAGKHYAKKFVTLMNTMMKYSQEKNLNLDEEIKKAIVHVITCAKSYSQDPSDQKDWSLLDDSCTRRVTDIITKFRQCPGVSEIVSLESNIENFSKSKMENEKRKSQRRKQKESKVINVTPIEAAVRIVAAAASSSASTTGLAAAGILRNAVCDDAKSAQRFFSNMEAPQLVALIYDLAKLNKN